MLIFFLLWIRDTELKTNAQYQNDVDVQNAENKDQHNAKASTRSIVSKSRSKFPYAPKILIYHMYLVYMLREVNLANGIPQQFLCLSLSLILSLALHILLLKLGGLVLFEM